MKNTHVSPWVARGVYLFAVALLMTAAIDFLSTVWPMRLGDFTWRYGFLGLMAGYLQTPTLGLVLAMAIALWQGDRAALRVTGLLSALAAVGVLVAMGTFLFDMIQMRGLRADEAQGAVLAGGFLQEVKYFVASAVLAFLGVGAIQTAKKMGEGNSPRAVFTR